MLTRNRKIVLRYTCKNGGIYDEKASRYGYHYFFALKTNLTEVTHMNHSNNYLAEEKIGKLMLKFSIPCIMSLLVASLYNIVDQIFIGQGIG